MSRRTTVIKLSPTSPDQFLTLCEAVVKRNNILGPASPLAGDDMVDMTLFAQRTELARQKRERAIELYAEAETLMAESRNLIGIGHAQTSLTTGTLYYLILKVKKLLQAMYTDTPEELSVWGFNVVMKLAKPGGRKKKVSV